MVPDPDGQDLVHALALTPTFVQDGLCFAARASGLYRSRDGGTSWQDAYHSLSLQTPLTTASVALSPNFNQDQTVFAGALGGILRSTDAGESWTVATLPSPPPFIVALAISPNYREDGLAFAAAIEDGVFRSWDRGISWAAWNFGLLDLNVFTLAISPDFADDDTLFAGTESGIFRSSNGGRAWREIPFPMEYAPVLSLAPSPLFRDDHTLYAGTEAQGLLCSSDRGETWQHVETPALSHPVNEVLVTEDGSSGHSLTILANGLVHILRSNESAWLTLPTHETSSDQLTVVSVLEGTASGATVVVGSSSGVMRRIVIE